MYGLPSKMKSSSHKTLQTPLLFLKPLQIQNLKRKKWGGRGILCPPRLKKWGGHVLRVPHQIAPMPARSKFEASACCPSQSPKSKGYTADFTHRFGRRLLLHLIWLTLNFISLQELERYRDAVKRMSGDIIKLRDNLSQLQVLMSVERVPFSATNQPIINQSNARCCRKYFACSVCILQLAENLCCAAWVKRFFSVISHPGH